MNWKASLKAAAGGTISGTAIGLTAFAFLNSHQYPTTRRARTCRLFCFSAASRGLEGGTGSSGCEHSLSRSSREGTMWREPALKVVLVVVGLIFSGLVYPLMMFVRQEPALAMMLSVRL